MCACFQALGLDFLPQKYWALAIPTYLSVLFFTFVLLIYPSLGRHAALSTLRAHSGQNTEGQEGMHSEQNREVLKGALPPIYEIPQSEVNSWSEKKTANSKKFQ
jgi:hypothetical protein